MSRSAEREESTCPEVEVLRGRDGRDGRDGERGPPGARGEMGPPGPQGPAGEREGAVDVRVRECRDQQ